MAELTFEGSTQVKGYRKIDKSVLLSLEGYAIADGFTDLDWTVTDSQGKHQSHGHGIESFWDKVLWQTVKELSLYVWLTIPADLEVSGVRSHMKSSVGFNESFGNVLVSWKADLEHRVEAERVASKMLSLLESLPQAEKELRFSAPSPIPPTAQATLHAPTVESTTPTVLYVQEVPGRKWWDVRRRPESILDHVVVGVLVAVLAAAAIAVVVIL